MILRQVLRAIESRPGPVNLDSLSRELGVDRGALDGMIAFWVRKGRLKVHTSATGPACAAGNCGAACSDQPGCPQATKPSRPHSPASPAED